MKNLSFIIIIAFLLGVGVLFAQTPTTNPGVPSGYTLRDIYEKIINDTNAVSGGHSVNPESAPGINPMPSLEDIYEAVALMGPRGDYTDNGDGTVTDNATGLVWQKCSPNLSGPVCTGSLQAMNWQTAIDYCSNLTLAGRSWRLPNINELLSLVSYDNESVVNPSVFPALPGIVWSSTTNHASTSQAKRLTLSNGTLGNVSKTTNTYTLCVS